MTHDAQWGVRGSEGEHARGRGGWGLAGWGDGGKEQSLLQLLLDEGG